MRTAGSRRGPYRRRASPRVRRRRAVVAGIGVVLLAVLAWVATRGGPSRPTPSNVAAVTTTSAPAGPGAGGASVRAAALAVTLPAPVSREVVVALGHGRLLVLGGLTATDTSSTVVATFDTASGAVSTVGSLAVPTHDAGGAALGRRAYVFGGGQATSVATVQAFPLSAAPASDTANQTAARVVGALPGARSDAGAVTVGRTTYVIGGYDGTAADPQVLATTDGIHFQVVATLPVPVRYGAVAALGGRLYVFGGEALTGTQAGSPVDLVQVVDPASHQAAVAGHLPVAIQGAAALSLGGSLYVAGGDSVATPKATSTPGSATSAAIWRFDPATGIAASAGHLADPVSYAGVATSGSTAWLVGGETGGTVRAVVQRLVVAAG